MEKFFKIFTIIFLISSTCFAAGEGFDALSYRPAADGSNFFSLWGNDTLMARQSVFGITVGGAYKSFQFVDNNAAVRDIIRSYEMNHLYFSRGIFTGWLSAGFDLPFGMMQVLKPASLSNTPSSTSVVGDPRLYAKIQFPDFLPNQLFTSGVLFYGNIPVGDSEYYVGNSGFTAGADFLLEFKSHRRFGVVLNIGPRFQKSYHLTNYTIGNQLSYGVGAFYSMTKHWNLVGELNGKAQLTNPFAQLSKQPTEALVGTRYSVGMTGLEFGSAVGAGLVRGFGTPEWRALVDTRLNF